jgi:hypothetical protein
MNTYDSEINLKAEISRLQELLNEKTKELEAAHVEIAALINFLVKSRNTIAIANVNVNVNVNEKQTHDGQDVIPKSKI